MKEKDWIDLEKKGDEFWDGFEAGLKMLLLKAVEENGLLPQYIEGDMLKNWVRVLMNKRHRNNTKGTKNLWWRR